MHTDCLAVDAGCSQGWWKDRHRALDDLLDLFWEVRCAATELSRIIVLYQVKAHSIVQDLTDKVVTWEHKVGNAFADTWAGYAAEINQADTEKMLVSWIEFRPELLQ